MPVSHLLSLSTAVPPHVLLQDEAKEIGRRAFKRPALFRRLEGVFDNADIATRNLVAPLKWYEGAHGWAERNRVYLAAAESLFEEAAVAAIAKAGLEPHQIDGVVTVSTTGIATPSLEARVGPRISLRSDIRRVPVFGLGCAGGVSGLGLAGRLAAAEPGTNWLFVTVET
ncbi:MAG: type III polyketide synthase, partial [Sphingomicrobium sp.]